MRTYVALATVALLVSAPLAEAKRLVVLTGQSPPHVRQIDSSAPGVMLSDVVVTGLETGEAVLGMDLRPATNELYVLTRVGTASRLRRLSPTSGALTAPIPLVADPVDGTSPFTALNGGVLTDIDFNATSDRLRVTDTLDTNDLVNPVNGFVTTQSNLNPPDPSIAAIAYTSSFAGATTTTLYAFDSVVNTLSILNPPANGTLALPGASGIAVQGPPSLDVSPDGNQAFLAAPTAGHHNLFSLNLETRAATLIGQIADDTPVIDLAATENIVEFASPLVSVPESSGSVQVPVSRADPHGTTTVRVTGAGAGASPGADFAAVDQTVTFQPGQVVAVVSVPLLDDAVVEPSEDLTLVLSELQPGAGTNGMLGASTTTRIRLTDDDPPPPPADGTAPAILVVPGSPTRSALRSAGLRVTFSCSEACTVRFTLTAGTTTIGTVTRSLSAAGVGRATVRLNARGRLLVRTAKRLTLTSRATDPAGNVRTSRSRIVLR